MYQFKQLKATTTTAQSVSGREREKERERDCRNIGDLHHQRPHGPTINGNVKPATVRGKENSSNIFIYCKEVVAALADTL